MRTIVHAGFHKTGTTSLQAFLSSASAWLQTQGVEYPLANRGASTAHHSLACACSSDRNEGGPNDLFVPERQLFCNRTDCTMSDPIEVRESAATHTRVISSEIFCTFDTEEMARLIARLGGVDQFVLYYRGGIGFLYSCWATKVRWGATGSFQEFLSDSLALRAGTPISGAFAFVDNLVTITGEHAVHLRGYDAAQRHAHGISGDFVENLLGLKHPADLPATPRMNPTPAPAQIELARALTCLRGDLHNPRPVFPLLKAALANDEHARRLVDSLCMIINLAMRPVSIESIDACNGALDSDGLVRLPGTRGAALLRNWSFPPQQVSNQVDTDALLDAIRDRSEARELLSLIAAPLPKPGSITPSLPISLGMESPAAAIRPDR